MKYNVCLSVIVFERIIIFITLYLHYAFSYCTFSMHLDFTRACCVSFRFVFRFIFKLYIIQRCQKQKGNVANIIQITWCTDLFHHRPMPSFLCVYCATEFYLTKQWNRRVCKSIFKKFTQTNKIKIFIFFEY